MRVSGASKRRNDLSGSVIRIFLLCAVCLVVAAPAKKKESRSVDHTIVVVDQSNIKEITIKETVDSETTPNSEDSKTSGKESNGSGPSNNDVQTEFDGSKTGTEKGGNATSDGTTAGEDTKVLRNDSAETVSNNTGKDAAKEIQTADGEERKPAVVSDKDLIKHPAFDVKKLFPTKPPPAKPYKPTDTEVLKEEKVVVVNDTTKNKDADKQNNGSGISTNSDASKPHKIIHFDVSTKDNTSSDEKASTDEKASSDEQLQRQTDKNSIGTNQSDAKHEK